MEKRPWFANYLQIVQAVAAVVGCIFTGIKTWPDVERGSGLLGTRSLFFAFVGLVIWQIVTIWRSRRVDPALSKIKAVILEQIIRKCDALLSSYRRLDYDHHDQCRLPFHASSCPAFDDKWGYVHVMLFTLKVQIRIFKMDIAEVFGELGRINDLPFPDITDSVVMVVMVDFSRRDEYAAGISESGAFALCLINSLQDRRQRVPESGARLLQKRSRLAAA